MRMYDRKSHHTDKIKLQSSIEEEDLTCMKEILVSVMYGLRWR